MIKTKNLFKNRIYISIIYIKEYMWYIWLCYIIINCFFITNDVCLCDDNISETGNNDNRQDISYPRYDNEGRPIYQPYREGIQNTSNGYRYEMDGSSTREGLHNTSNGYRYEVEGRPVNHHDNHPCSYESSRRVNLNQMYSNNNNNTYNSANVPYSTKIAVNPKSNSVVNSNSTIGGDTISSSKAKKMVKDIYTKPLAEGQSIYSKRPNKARAIWDVIKDDFRNTRDEAYKSRKISGAKSENIVNSVHESRKMQALNKLEARNKYYFNNPVKPRRFD